MAIQTGSTDSSPISFWLAQFENPTLEAEYRAAAMPSQRRYVLAYCLLGVTIATLAVLILYTAFAGEPERQAALLWNRAPIILVGIGVCVFALFATSVQALDGVIICLGTLCGIGTYSYQPVADPEAIGLVFRGFAALFMVHVLSETRFSLFLCIALGVGATIAHQFATFLTLEDHEWVIAVMSVFAMTAAGIIARWRSETRRRENFALSRQLRAARKEAELANAAKSRFLAEMSHELRTPLNAVIGMSDALKRGMVGQIGNKPKEYVTDIQGAGQHLLTLINDLLDLSKIEAGKLSLEVERFDLADAIQRVLPFVQDAKEQNQVEIMVNLNTAPAHFKADPRYFRQMLINLVGNAVKFSPKGGTVQITAQSLEGGGCAVSVTDQGPGMTEEERETVLRSYEQTELGRSQGGTGLGLSLVEQMMRLHSGRLELESVPGTGTTARLMFPPQQIKP